MPLPAPVLTGATLLPDLTPDGRKQLHLTSEQYALPAGYFSPVLAAGERSAGDTSGKLVDGGVVATLDNVSRVTETVVQAPATGTIEVGLYVQAFTSDPWTNSSATWEESPMSNLISVNLDGVSPLAALAKTSKGKGRNK